MCSSNNAGRIAANPDEPQPELISLTADQLEDLVTSAVSSVPSANELLAAISSKGEPNREPFWTKCGPCIAGFMVCVSCSWRGCKVRLRKCG